MENSNDPLFSKRAALRTVAHRNLNKTRKFFDSADWMMEKNSDSLPNASTGCLPIRTITERLESSQPANTSHFETRHFVSNKQLEIEQELETVNDMEIEEEDDPEVRCQLKQYYVRNKIMPRTNRKFFDSADWVLEGKENINQTPLHTYPMFPQPSPSSILIKKKLSKSKKYFDSADWALEMQGYSSQIYPKLTLLISH